jgi:hypothetical protein
MSRLSFLVGQWKGEGWIQQGPRRHNVIERESLTPKLGGDVILIEGRGVSADDTSAVVHQAVGMLGYDAANGRYVMQTFLPGGLVASPDVTVGNEQLDWQIGSNVRYSITLDEEGRWFEIGEFSRDGGATWTRFFQMTLERMEPGD